MVLKIKNHYRDNREIKKDILSNHRYMLDKELKVSCATTVHEDSIYTNLIIDIYTADGAHMESYITHTIEGSYIGEDIDINVNGHRSLLKGNKKKLCKYLENYFYSVKSCDDYIR